MTERKNQAASRCTQRPRWSILKVTASLPPREEGEQCLDQRGCGWVQPRRADHDVRSVELLTFAIGNIGDPDETVGPPDGRGALARGKFERSGQKRVA